MVLVSQITIRSLTNIIFQNPTASQQLLNIWTSLRLDSCISTDSYYDPMFLNYEFKKISSACCYIAQMCASLRKFLQYVTTMLSNWQLIQFEDIRLPHVIGSGGTVSLSDINPIFSRITPWMLSQHLQMVSRKDCHRRPQLPPTTTNYSEPWFVPRGNKKLFVGWLTCPSVLISSVRHAFPDAYVCIG